MNVILDGSVNEENLKQTGNNLVWLNNQLRVQGFSRPEDIFLDTVNTVDNTIKLYPVNVENNTKDPFE